MIYLNFLFNNIFIQNVRHANFTDYPLPNLSLLFVSAFIIYFLFFFYKNLKKFNFNNDKFFWLILLLISFGIFGSLNYLSLDYLILLRFSLLIIICLLVLSFFYVSKFENFSIFLICLIIVTNIIILISFTNYHTENFNEIVLFGYKVLPTNPSNQKFIFLLLNTFVLFFIIENNNNFTFKLLISILIIINFLFLLRYANTYIIFLTILSILYIFTLRYLGLVYQKELF